MTYDERNESAYLSRMHLIQRWRNGLNLLCLFLIMYIGFLVWLDGSAIKYTTRLMIQSLAAFGVAAIMAVNLLTFFLRKPSAIRTVSTGAEKDG